MSWVDAEETSPEARRRRRYELARGWRFKCECTRCLAEQTEGSTEADLGVSKDESKLEDAAARFEARKAQMEASETD